MKKLRLVTLSHGPVKKRELLQTGRDRLWRMCSFLAPNLWAEPSRARNEIHLKVESIGSDRLLMTITTMASMLT